MVFVSEIVENCIVCFFLEIKMPVVVDLKDGFLQDGKISTNFFLAKMLIEMSHETYHADLVRIQLVPFLVLH